ncbi:hypothetical protein ACTXT7_000600 [Hymenolepis weldensis]
MWETISCVTSTGQHPILISKSWCTIPFSVRSRTLYTKIKTNGNKLERVQSSSEMEFWNSGDKINTLNASEDLGKDSRLALGDYNLDPNKSAKSK